MSNHKKIVARVNINSIIVDPRVQRPLDTTRVEKIAKSFNHDYLGTVTVSQRDNGTYVALDGQTRTAGARKAGYAGDVDAVIFLGLTLAEEASIFLNLNDTKKVQAVDKFLVRVTEGDPTAVEISRIITSHGWTIKQGNSNHYFAAVVAIEKAYTHAGSNGSNLVEWVMKTITDAWDYNKYSVNAAIVSGLAELYARYGADIQTQKLVLELQTIAPRILLGRAKQLQDAHRGSLATAMGRNLHIIHNNKMRKNALPEWK